MRFKLFRLSLPLRWAAVPLTALFTSLLGGITTSPLGAIGLALLFVLGYTALENGLFRRVLLGKVGSGPLGWFGFQAFGEALSFVLVAYAIGAFFGVAISSWVGWVAYALTGIALVQDTFRTFLLNVALWMEVRGRR